MEFWGVEVKPGKVLKCDPGDDKYLHISQVALGEIKNTKGNERITLYVHVDDKKVVIGSLVYGKSDQFSLDLVFEREFKLSHSCTTGSVFFSGYSTLTDGGDDAMGGFDDTDSNSEDEQQAQALMSQVKANVHQTESRLVKPEAKKDGAKSAKPAVTTGKEGAKVKTEVKPVSAPKPGEDEKSSDEEEDDEDEDEDMEGSSDEEAETDESDGDSEDESDEEEDKKTPKAKAAGKKRPSPDSATKSSGIYKQAKISTPSGAQRLGTDEGKKNGPKVPGVTSAPTSKQHKGQTPKAKGTPGSKEIHKPPTTPGSEKKIGDHPCTPCGKIFKTEAALSQHASAKHGKK